MGGAWLCSAFRNERPDLYRSSDLVREAVAATRWRWPSVPDLGMVTFVDERKVRRKRDPGRCFTKAGFEMLRELDIEAGCFVPIRTVTEKLLVFAMDVGEMPEAEEPLGANLSLFDHRGADSVVAP